MNLNEVKKFVSFFNETKLSELEVEFEGNNVKSIKAKRVLSEGVTVQPSEIVTVEEVNEVIDGEEVLSPLVGTFYAAPGPEHANFIEVGHEVKQGQTLCIIEAMKVMNEIKAPKDGKIIEICVNNEEVVEFEQPLVVIG